MTQMRVLETNILHASDVLYWLDGSSAETLAAMKRIAHPLLVSFTNRPGNLQWLNTAGKTALWRRLSGQMVAGVASDADKVLTPEATYSLEGVVSDAEGRYLPRLFEITAGNAAGHPLVLYPAPLGVRFGRGGGLLGTLRFSTTGQPVAWAMLTLSVTTALGEVLTFRGQANGAGDFLLPSSRVPPLPEGVQNYDATLAVAASTSADGQTPLDPADLTAMTLGEIGSPDVFSDPISFTVVPGDIRSIRSMNKDHLAVQPV